MDQHDFGISAKDMAESELNSRDAKISSSGGTSNYDDLKSIRLLNVYRSSTNPEFYAKQLQLFLWPMKFSMHGTVWL